MIIYNRYNEETGILIRELVEYDEETIAKSKKIFEDLKSKGVILSNFEESVWYITNEIEKRSLSFDFNEILYKKESIKRDMYTYEQFVDSVKSYVVLSIRKKSIVVMQRVLLNLKKYILETNYFNINKSKNRLECLGNIKYIAELLVFIQGYLNFVAFEGVEAYNELVEDDLEYALKMKGSQNSDNRRKLSDFQSVFLFDKIINGFWKNSADNIDKQLYFPLYLWWQIANIIPIRLNEFCVTPYDCIEKDDNGEYKIILRRSKLKGTKSSKVAHKINDDYVMFKYPVSKEIVELINEYKNITQRYRRQSDLLICHTTFILRAYNFEDDTLINHSDSSIFKSTFNRQTLSHLLKRFFIKIAQDRYAYKLINYEDFIEDRIESIDMEEDVVELEFKPLSPNEITVFKLADIRHYAMINMILNDVSPILIRDIVHHRDIDTSFHYFGNVDELVKCISYIKYKELCDANSSEVVGKTKLNVSANKVLNSLEVDISQSIKVDNGLCTSKYFRNAKLDSCIIVDGVCENCDYFILEKPLTKEQRKEKLKLIERKLKAEGELLGDLLESYQKSLKPSEDLIQSKLKFQNSMQLHYQELVKNGWYDEE